MFITGEMIPKANNIEQEVEQVLNDTRRCVKPGTELLLSAKMTAGD